nr:uncharacterized protein LOC113723902 isoform X2 [Coffea arabica]
MFNNDISKISHQLQIYKKYLNSNAIVRLILEKYQTSDLKIQWVITSRTVIEPANDDDDILPVKFNCIDFNDLVSFMDDKEKSVDVLGIVVQALDVKHINRNGKDSVVQKFVIVNTEDRKNAQLLNDLVTDAAYMKYNPDFALKPDHKITKIILLKPTQKSSWVRVFFSFEHIFQKFWYMGCKKCFRSTAAPHRVVFTCNSCKEKHPAEPRCRFDVDLTDSTGTITASIFSELAENLLTFIGLEAMDHFTQVYNEDNRHKFKIPKLVSVFINETTTPVITLRAGYRLLQVNINGRAFTGNWSSFVLQHDLQLNEKLVFIPETVNSFTVQVYKTDGTEKIFPWYHNYYVHSYLWYSVCKIDSRTSPNVIYNLAL